MSKILKAWIRKNILNTNDYTVVVSYQGNVGMNEIVDELLKEGLDVKREVMIDILIRFNRKVAEMVLAGHNVNTGLVNIHLNFRDKLSNQKTVSGCISIDPGTNLHAAIAETSVEILGVQPNPIGITSLSETLIEEADDKLMKTIMQN